jgi:hypothetical protein
MALSGISQTTDTSNYQSYTPAATTVFTTDPSAAGAAPIISKADAGTVATAVDLGELPSVVANLGANQAGAQTYNAAGLLNSIAQAGQALTPQKIPAADTDIPAYEQDLTDLAVVSTLGTSPGASGIYTPSGSLQDLPIYAANIRNNGSIVNTQA